MPIKTFRGLMKDNDQDTIVLHTNDGSIGYKIKDLRLMPNKPGDSDYEFICQVWKVEQAVNIPGGTDLFAKIDFSSQTLLAAATIEDFDTAAYIATTGQVIFDNEIFNQDIYVTMRDKNTGEDCNYYLELEQIKLDLNENTVATLKDIRNVTTPT